MVVIGGGPAGVIAASRAARPGARTALITGDGLGGTAAADGPVPVRTLAHAARLIREARQLPRYGITAGEPGSTTRGWLIASGRSPQTCGPIRCWGRAGRSGVTSTSTPAPPVSSTRT